ncbi:TetR/AcrR family transcriptional regulator [Massilia cavernae]|uniref:TetR/AcrR family transcriptional regulator n=1 Tax=Massilia cavernae TaxID=2320864 RepID=UPI001E3906B9|nr:TetR/AcrR family transcriptional regulator [Massilia cavernae]
MSKPDKAGESKDGPVRADARRNVEAVLQAAMTVFDELGVDAPVREIAQKAGVGIGTIYRHFPQRSDLIVAIVQKEVDACADASVMLAGTLPPAEALAQWMQRLVELIATKRGLAAALHSGASAYQALPDYFLKRLTPALQMLLEAAVSAGVIRGDIDASELLMASTRLAMPAAEGDMAQARRMVSLLVDGLRFGATISDGTMK